ncbi:MAG TPA: PRC-barrel domain-containing protein [Terriglobales bacterium]|nr:PRC-barrel domain-containing protein [Terriglobales bacterium]
MLRQLSQVDRNDLNDLRGTSVYGPNDEKLGSVDDALVDDSSGDLRYLVMDAGWLKSRRFILPAEQVYAFGDGADLYANLRQRDVESLPEFRDETLASDAAFANYESEYRSGWRYDAEPSRMQASTRLAALRDHLRSRWSRPGAGEKRAVAAVNDVTTLGARQTGVYGIFADRDNVEKAVDRLRREGFNSSDISVVFPDRELNKEFAIEKNTKAPEGGLTGGGAGLVVGGVLGWLVGIGTLAIPGVGPLIAAGPIVAALAGAGVGGAVGGIAGSLIGLGLPELEAKQYEEEIKRGRILVSVHCDSVGLAHQARKVLEDSGGKSVFLSGEQRAA